MAKIKQKEFELKSAVMQPSVHPYVLEGSDMPEVLKAINGVVDAKYKGNSNLKILQLRKVNGVDRIVRSNSLIRPVIDEVLPRYRGIRPEEMEATLREGDFLGIRGNHYVDYGVVLDFSGNNHELAVEVFRKLPKKLRDFDRLPAVMLDYGLENSEKGDYGVVPIYREETEFRTAKILSQPTGRFSSDDKELIRTGLPSKLGVGERTLYILPQSKPSKDSLGISRFGLDGYLNLNSSWCCLASSGSGGRVVSVVREAARSGK